MTAKVRIELNHEGIAALLSSDAVAAECEKAAERVAQAAGEGFEVTERKKLGYGGGRIGYGVAAQTDDARKRNAEEDALWAAVSACRS